MQAYGIQYGELKPPNCLLENVFWRFQLKFYFFLKTFGASLGELLLYFNVSNTDILDQLRYFWRKKPKISKSAKKPDTKNS